MPVEPQVDIIVPTYNESAAILTRTIKACQQIAYDNKVVWLLDDTRRTEIRQLAEQLGCHYISRPDNQGAKAGNMNHGLRQMKGELVSVFDADVMPSPNFLERTVPLIMADAKIAVVQARFSLYGQDAIQELLFQENLPVVKQPPGVSTLLRNYMFSHCSGHSYLVRRQAIDSVDGYPTNTQVEDFYFTLKILSAGWHIKYINDEPLASASCPCGLDALVKQQVRWSRAAWQMWCLRPSPFLVPGLPFCHKAAFFGKCLMKLIQGGLSLFALVLPLLLLCLVAAPAVSADKPVGGWQWCALAILVSVDITARWVASHHYERNMTWMSLFNILMAWPLVKELAVFVFKPFGVAWDVAEKPEPTGSAGPTVHASSTNTNHAGSACVAGAAGFTASPVKLEQRNIPWHLLSPVLVFLSLYAIAFGYYGYASVQAGGHSLYGLAVLAWCVCNAAALVGCVALCLRRRAAR